MASTHRRKVRLLALGGTIACRETGRGLVPKLGAEDLIASVEVPNGVTIDGSDAMVRTIVFPEDWTVLATLIFEELDKFDGFVLTLGTDSLAYAACALSLMLPGLPCPVVLTGAMQPITEPHPQSAQRNLSDALRVATSQVGGVFVVFHGQLLDGRRSSKVVSDEDAAFASINFPPLGSVGEAGIHWSERPGDPDGDIELKTELDTRVTVYQLCPQTTREDLGTLGRYRGIVIEGFGDGNVQEHLVPTLNALARERVVVLASQCPRGRVRHRYTGGAALIDSGALSSSHMTTEMACVGLMWALGQSADDREARRIFQAL